MYYFTTLTQISEIPTSSLDAFLPSISIKHLYVLEKGKNGDNPHYHILYETESEQRTDHITTKFKTNLYKNHPNLKSHTLVVTKIAKNWKKLYSSYLLKEVPNKTFSNLKFVGFDETVLKKLYREAQVNNMFNEVIYISMIKAPMYMLNFLKDNNKDFYQDYSGQATKLLWAMGSTHKFIVHHLLDDRQINKITYGIEMLLQKSPSKDAIEIDT